jgi:uncharacterized phage protein gp47/JayE
MSSLDYFQQAAPPLSVDTVETILGRIVADQNAGIDPNDPSFLDLTPGAIANDFDVAFSIEIDRLRDFASNEVPRTGIPTLAQGPFLDAHAEANGLARKEANPADGLVTFTGAAGTIVNTGVVVATEAPAPDANGQAFQTTAGGTVDSSLGGGQGVVMLPVVAQLAGSAGNVLSGAISQLNTGVGGITAVTNALPMSGGADVESDSQLQDRLGNALAGTQGAGTISDYQRWFLAIPGVGNVSVQSNWAGTCTVRVMVTDENNNPLSTAFIAAQQAAWDPNANGDGSGLGPIGHILTIATPVGLAVTVAATVTFNSGYSYDGTAGTRAIRANIVAAIQAYISSLPAGGYVILNKVLAAILDVEGVANVSVAGSSALKLNGTAADLPISSADVALFSTATLS